MKPSILIIAIATACMCSIAADARKQSTISRRLKPAANVTQPKQQEAVSDTLTPAAIDRITLAGYDKPINANRESFFVTNGTELTPIVSLTITFTYTDMTGRLLHKATHTINCDIPAGETRSASVPAWDRQHSFYYHKSTVPRRSSTPYAVTHTIDRALGPARN